MMVILLMKTRILNILNNYLNWVEEEKEDFIKLAFYYENNGTILEIMEIINARKC